MEYVLGIELETWAVLQLQLQIILMDPDYSPVSVNQKPLPDFNPHNKINFPYFTGPSLDIFVSH